MPITHAWFAGGVVAVAIGAGVAVSSYRGDLAFVAGLALILIGLASLAYQQLCQQVGALHTRVGKEQQSIDDAYELGYQMGYDRGWTEGHKSSRPVVVPFVRRERESIRADGSL